MLDSIEFSPKDTLILAGDYVDRGKENLQMLEWIEKCPSNVILLMGNHDMEFISSVELLSVAVKDINSNEALAKGYESIKMNELGVYFDYYGSVKELIYENNCALKDLLKWCRIIKNFPLFYEMQVEGKRHIIVHAGYKIDCNDEFYIYSRDEAYLEGGIVDGVIIAGHTPTLCLDSIVYNYGEVFSYHNPKNNCTFYDIDCGAAYGGKLACLRLEDKVVFYK